MSRYTKQTPDDYSYAEYLVALPWANEDDIINRLGRIEDILYTEDGTEIITLGRLRELAAAERDGWCVILPCKTGEPVWYIRKFCKYANHDGYCDSEFWYAKKGFKKESGCCDCPRKTIERRIMETKFRLALMDERRVGHLHVSECYFTYDEARAALKGESK